MLLFLVGIEITQKEILILPQSYLLLLLFLYCRVCGRFQTGWFQTSNFIPNHNPKFIQLRTLRQYLYYHCSEVNVNPQRYEGWKCRKCLFTTEVQTEDARWIWSICAFDQMRCSFGQLRKLNSNPNLTLTLKLSLTLALILTLTYCKCAARLTKYCAIRQKLRNW